MKKQLMALAFAVGLSAVSLPAFAEQGQPSEKKQPVKMSEQEMDSITAGLLAIQLSARSYSTNSARSFVAGPGIASASAFSRSGQSLRISVLVF